MKVEIRTVSANDALSLKYPPGSKGVVDGGSFGAVLQNTQAQQSDAAQELDAYMKMTPEERVAKAMRQQLGISDDQYNAMTPEQKKAVDEKIAEMIKQKLQQQIAEQTGKVAS
ncbi:hypothetical protein FHW58_005159 [Duganella sp. 1224]|uniref:hypothetical protein n=1 Tax=Duganella sp. 1224 TaxID=2587052 RepID=UPI0015C9D5FB|nr:hypothetical protein [Duganella sp. 1224]NYE63925.1 hypothetical protein [Duganella sp. 1224]